MKYEKLIEATDDEPGLIEVHTMQLLEDGTEEKVTETFNTVSFCCLLRQTPSSTVKHSPFVVFPI